MSTLAIGANFVKKWVKLEYVIALIVLLGVGSLFIAPAATGVNDTKDKESRCKEDKFFCRAITNEESAANAISRVPVPGVKKPDWLAAQEQQAQQRQNGGGGNSAARVVTYQIETRGNIQSSLEQFATQVAQTYADERGWSRAGITFQRVESGGQYILVLSEASQVPTFSPGCDAIYSCRAGQYVIINEDRWIGATDAWNSQGGNLRDYRHMVINHETGHWLGHGHYNCEGAGQLAPVMQQQSIDLQGCKFNPWPLDFEIAST